MPLIYEFFKSQFPDLPRELEKEKKADELTSGDIIAAGMQRNDELCMKVIKKFSEIFAVEVGNAAVKMLPYGGIYLVGGVLNGVRDYLEKDHNFMQTVY